MHVQSRIPAALQFPDVSEAVCCAEAAAPKFMARNISNACWGFARLGFSPSDSMMEALAAEAVTKVSGFNPQNFGNLLWAWGIIGEFEPNCQQAAYSRSQP